MKAQDFLKYLESEKLVTQQVLKKLHHKVNSAGRSVSAQSIASYLIKKDLIDRDQATDWISRFAAIQEAKGELVANAAGERDSHNSMELISMAGPPTSHGPVATRDLNDDSGGDDPVDVELLEEVSESQKPVSSNRKAKSVAVSNVEEVEEVLELGHDQMVAADNDPLFTGNAVVDPFAKNEAEQPEEKPASKYSFGGKKRNNQWVSKWPLIGSGVLLALIVFSIIIWRYLFSISADDQWTRVMDLYNNSNYGSAISELERFLDNYPNDDRASKAKVLVVNCELRIPYDGRDWETVKSRAHDRLPQIAEEESFDELHEDLAVILPGTTEGFTQKGLVETTIAGKQKYLDLALDMLTLVNRPDFIPTSQRKRDVVSNTIEAVDNNVSILERQIQMEKDYEAALGLIETDVNAGKTYEAFIKYTTLVRNYPEIETREPLRDKLKSISDKESELISTSKPELQLTNTDAKTNVKASVVLATQTGESVPGVEGIVAYLIDGSIYALSAEDGSIKWRRFVGLPTLIQPQWLNAESQTDLIAVDQRDHSILRISASDGSLVWRSVVGQPFVSPLIDEERIIVSTFFGQVIELDANDGSGTNSATVPQPLEVGGVVAERDPYIYQPGSHSNLYVLSKEDYSCREVYFLAHGGGSIKVSPFYISGHLLIAVNGNEYCNIHVLRSAERGLKLEQAQSPISLKGRVTTPIFRYRRWAIVMTDKGEMQMLEVNLGDEKTPVTSIATTQFDVNPNVTNYVYADENQVYVAGKGVVRYRIQKTNSTFERQQIANNQDEFIGQPSQAFETLFHVRRRHNSSMVSVSAVDPGSLQEKWRSDFSGALAGPLFVHDGKNYGLNSQGDVFPIDQQSLESGLTKQVMRASNQMQDLTFNQLITMPDGTFVGFGPEGRRNLVNIDFNKRVPANLLRFEESITNPTCDVIRFGKQVLLATERGQVYRLNPATGQSFGEPFQPALEPQKKTIWRKPVVLNDGESFFIADQSGRTFVVKAEGDRALSRVAEFTYDSQILSAAILLDDHVALVAAGDGNDRLVKLAVGNEITVAEKVDLSGQMIDGPYAVDNRVLVLTDDGKINCFDANLSLLWSLDMPRDRLAGAPAVIDGNVVLAMESGLVQTVNADSGAVVGQFDVGQPLAGTPSIIDGNMFVSGTDGTVFLLDGQSN